MTVQTTTLPAADPIRLGSQPIRRRALVPRAVALVEASAGPDDDVPVDEPEQPETDASEAVAVPEAAAVAAAPEAVEPPRRGRGRPRKDVVDVIAQGRPKYDDAALARLRASSVNVTHTPDPGPMISDMVATEHDVTKLGYAVVQAAKCGLRLEEYIGTVRGIIAAYDRLYGSE